MGREPYLLKESNDFRLHFQGHTSYTSSYNLDNFDLAINLNSMTAEHRIRNCIRFTISHIF